MRSIDLKVRIGRENGGRNPSIEFVGDDWARDLCGADRVCRSSMENGILLSFLKDPPGELSQRNPDLTKDSLVVQKNVTSNPDGRIGWRIRSTVFGGIDTSRSRTVRVCGVFVNLFTIYIPWKGVPRS